jgi:hypothetical protein
MVSGLHGKTVKELSCPTRFNPKEGMWIPTDGMNPHECPRNENFMRIQKQMVIADSDKIPIFLI